MRVTILGAGMMGSAIAVPIADRGHPVRLVGTALDAGAAAAMRDGRAHPGLGVEMPAAVSAEPVEDVAGAIAWAEAIVLGVSSAGIDWAADVLARHLPARLPIAMVTKGLLPDPGGGGLRILPDVLAARLPATVRPDPVAVTGPCIAGEIARRRPTAVALAGRDPRAATLFAEAFRGPYYRPDVSIDPVGACTCAALKNAYATAVGIAGGLHGRGGGAPGSVAMHNLEAALFARSLQEMEVLVGALGGRRDTVAGLAGAGDLFVTCQGGRSTRLGRLLGLGRSLAEARAELSSPGLAVTLEGVEIAAAVVSSLPRTVCAEDLPVLHRLHDVLFAGAGPEMILEAF